MSSTYRITADAKSDLIDIRRFTVQQWGLEKSRQYLSGVRTTLQLLAETPSMGQRRPELGADVSSFPHVSHVIYFLVHNDQVIVFAVLHKRMVPSEHLACRNMI
ncbi:type II toxin-antitoxin system RelE/ParE family toxin [Nitrincola sp. MINF-07-Sa-05]|uniref:type II toxin-antitoxin system RelE/ParE family toxin n=1 Tax=Nitrincola salilacus TaxID=3400273 RepID=UPI003917E35A